MLNIRRILFPTDFSDSSSLALRHAVKLAQEHRSELHVLHAIVLHEEDPYSPEHRLPNQAEILSSLEKLAEERMGALVQDRDAPGLALRHVHRRGVSAAPVIVDYVREEGVDLVVMGTHGRRGVRKLLLGSVAAEVTRLAPCPVMTVRGKGEESRSWEIRRVLVPTDFSEPGKEPLAVACHLAATYGAKLQLVHVLPEVLRPAFYDMGMTRIGPLEEGMLQRVEAELGDLLVETGPCQGVPAECFALEGHPGREIVRFSRDHGSDLIVMATHGLTGIQHLLMGSTAEKVMVGAECPVLVVKGSGESLLPRV